MFSKIFFGTILALALSTCAFGLEKHALELGPRITSWIKSTGYGYGNFSSYRADVMQIYVTKERVYINSNSIPSYSIGPWNDDPNTAAAQNFTVSFPLRPEIAKTKTATSLGPVGLYTNGVAIFNGWDGTTYNNDSVWQVNAFMKEGISFDSCNGHPDVFSVYHNHVNPVCLYDSTDSSKHSPIIGFMFDGYPVYGPFGYSSAVNSKSRIKRLLPSYKLRTYVKGERRSLVNGTILSPKYYGPDVDSTYPLGYFIQDYEYARGLGDLDQYNGRWCVTPEFPHGTYAYFIATNSSGLPAYPYSTGPDYYGTVSTTSSNQNIPSSAKKYFSIY